MTFNEIATHTAVFTFAPGPADHLDSTGGRRNVTGIPWAGLEIALHGADFGGWEGGTDPDTTPSPSLNPVVDIGTDVTNLESLPTNVIGLRHGGLLDFTVDSSSILRSNDQGSGPLDATLVIDFGVPVPSPTSFFFFLHHKIIPPAGDPTATGFTVSMTPIPIPEPATVILLGAGLLGVPRRRGIRQCMADRCATRRSGS